MSEDTEIVEVEVKEIKADEHSLAIMPAMSLDLANERYTQMVTFVKSQMKEGLDYGTIPGTNKPTLYKPGAEKLSTFFGLDIRFSLEDSKEDWGEDSPFFYYRYKCKAMRGNRVVAELDGSCNSREDRYAWRWVDASEVNNDQKSKLQQKVSSKGHFRWQIDKAETTGQHGKPEEYWEQFRAAMESGSAKSEMKKQYWNDEMAEFISINSVAYRIPNPAIFTLVNTIQKMAQKRAQVGAVILAANASEFFTQDIEDDPKAFGLDENKKTDFKKESPEVKLASRFHESILNELVRKDYFIDVQEGANILGSSALPDNANTKTIENWINKMEQALQDGTSEQAIDVANKAYLEGVKKAKAQTKAKKKSGTKKDQPDKESGK